MSDWKLNYTPKGHAGKVRVITNPRGSESARIEGSDPARDFFSILSRDNEFMPGQETATPGIQFVTDSRGRRVAVQIDLKTYGALWEDFWDSLVAASRRNEESVPYEQYRASRLKRRRSRG